jgi:hypothetical protein
MTKLEYSIVIRRRPEDVFQFLSAHLFEKKKKWPDLIESQQTSEGPVGIGTTGRQLTEDRWGRRVETAYTVTEYEPNVRLVMRGVSRFSAYQPKRRVTTEQAAAHSEHTITYDLEPIGEDTHVTFSTEYNAPEIHGLYHLLSPLWLRSWKETTEERVFYLKNLMEAEVGLPATRKPFRLRWVWVFWIAYALIFLALFWLHSARTELQLVPDIVGTLRTVLSLMVALAIILAIGTLYLRPR